MNLPRTGQNDSQIRTRSKKTNQPRRDGSRGFFA